MNRSMMVLLVGQISLHVLGNMVVMVDMMRTTNAAAIAGAHHGDDSCLKPGSVDQSAQGADITTSYRWLGGIEGIEDPDWEWTATDGTTDHNQYKGVNGNSSYGDKTTISYLCAQCHGYFHSDIGSWTRHPTDIVLPSDTVLKNTICIMVEQAQIMIIV
ncbi:hypothetical protein DMNBHIDG_00815 [Candidatus Methanoperedenaceae archaeon GB37]|nr:hypothetical protein DMNBHIDG_00815 [Candidatus Methanoperedenaceae archaeon GB37]